MAEPRFIPAPKMPTKPPYLDPVGWRRYQEWLTKYGEQVLAYNRGIPPTQFKRRSQIKEWVEPGPGAIKDTSVPPVYMPPYIEPSMIEEKLAAAPSVTRVESQPIQQRVPYAPVAPTPQQIEQLKSATWSDTVKLQTGELVSANDYAGLTPTQQRILMQQGIDKFNQQMNISIAQNQQLLRVQQMGYKGIVESKLSDHEKERLIRKYYPGAPVLTSRREYTEKLTEAMEAPEYKKGGNLPYYFEEKRQQLIASEPRPFRGMAEVLIPGYYVSTQWKNLSNLERAANILLDAFYIASLGTSSAASSLFRMSTTRLIKPKDVKLLFRYAQQSGNAHRNLQISINRLNTFVGKESAISKQSNFVTKLQAAVQKNSNLVNYYDRKMLDQLDKVKSLTQSEIRALEKSSQLKGLAGEIKNVNKVLNKLDDQWSTLEKWQSTANKGKFYKAGEDIALDQEYIRRLTEIQLTKNQLDKALIRYGDVIRPRTVEGMPAMSLAQITGQNKSALARMKAKLKGSEGGYIWINPERLKSAPPPSRSISTIPIKKEELSKLKVTEREAEKLWALSNRDERIFERLLKEQSSKNNKLLNDIENIFKKDATKQAEKIAEKGDLTYEEAAKIVRLAKEHEARINKLFEETIAELEKMSSRTALSRKLVNFNSSDIDAAAATEPKKFVKLLSLLDKQDQIKVLNKIKDTEMVDRIEELITKFQNKGNAGLTSKGSTKGLGKLKSEGQTRLENKIIEQIMNQEKLQYQPATETKTKTKTKTETKTDIATKIKLKTKSGKRIRLPLPSSQLQVERAEGVKTDPAVVSWNDGIVKISVKPPYRPGTTDIDYKRLKVAEKGKGSQEDTLKITEGDAPERLIMRQGFNRINILAGKKMTHSRVNHIHVQRRGTLIGSGKSRRQHRGMLIR